MSSSEPVLALPSGGYGGSVRSNGCGPRQSARVGAGPGSGLGQRVFDDYVQRDFTAAAPNLTWLTDIAEHPSAIGGTVYCCAIKDVFSNRIVGYATGERMTATWPCALHAAIARRRPEGSSWSMPTEDRSFELAASGLSWPPLA